MAKRVSSLPGVALMAIAAGSPLMAVKAAGAPQGAGERVAVEVGTVSVRPVTVRSWIPGSIMSRADARIASVIGGRVMWIARSRRTCQTGRSDCPAR